MNISDMFGVPLGVMFPGGLRHLFTNDFRLVSEPEGALYRSWRFYCFEGQLPTGYNLVKRQMNEWPELADYEETERAVCTVPYHSEECIDFEYARVPANMRRVYLPYVRSLEPVPEVAREVSAQLPRASECIGVHVRRGDSVRLPWVNQNTDERFFAVLDRLPSDSKLFLCTDSTEVERTFADRYGLGTRLYYYQKRSWNQGDEQGQQDALIDLLLLSSCRVIIGSRYSTFTELAWWLGGCQAEVVIVPPVDPNGKARRDSRSSGTAAGESLSSHRADTA